MQRRILGSVCSLSVAASAGGQIFQPVEAFRYQTYGVSVFDPENCEGLEDEIYEWRYDLEPMDGHLDRTLRCLQARARGISIHEAVIGGDAIAARLRTTSDLSNGAIVPEGETEGTGDNFERFTFELVQATKLRIVGYARGRVTGDAEVASRVYLDAGFVFDGESGVHVELAFSNQLSGEGALEREIICPPGRYTFAAAATVWSCELDLQMPQQVTADAEVVVRVEVVYCPGDLDVDNQCDVVDLARLLGHFGSASLDRSHGDLDGNHRVDAADLSLLLASFGQVCW